MIRRPCTDFLTRPSACLPACLLACLPACLSACLPVLPVLPAYPAYPACPACPTCPAYPTVLPVCTCLSVPTCLCLPVCACLSCLLVYAYLSVSVIRGRGRPDRRLCLIRLRLIVLIRIVLYRSSLAIRLNGGRLGCLPRRP